MSNIKLFEPKQIRSVASTFWLKPFVFTFNCHAFKGVAIELMFMASAKKNGHNASWPCERE